MGILAKPPGYCGFFRVKVAQAVKSLTAARLVKNSYTAERLNRPWSRSQVQTLSPHSALSAVTSWNTEDKEAHM